MITRLKILISILCCLILYLAYYFVTPKFITKELIENVAKQEFGYTVKIDSPKVRMGLTPTIWMQAEKFEVLNSNESRALWIKKPKLEIQLLPLIIKQTKLNYFSAYDIDAKLSLDKDGNWKLGQYLLIPTSDSKISLEGIKVYLGHYNIALKDYKNKNNIDVTGTFLKISKLNIKKQIKLATSAKILVNGAKSTIDCDIDLKMPLKKNLSKNFLFTANITNLNLKNLSPYIVTLTKNDIKALNGVINLEAKTIQSGKNHSDILCNLVTEKLLIKRATREETIDFPKKLIVETVGIATNKKIQIDKFRIKSQNIDFGLSGEINNYRAKKQDLDIAVMLNKSRIEDLIKLIPATEKLHPEINFYILKKYGYFGDIMANLSIKGNSEEPDIVGKIISNNGYVIKPIPNSPKATIKITFFGRKLILNVKVPTSPSQVVKVKGNVELYGEKYSELHINSTEAINLALAQEVLMPIHQVFKFDLGPVPIMKISGMGNIDIKTYGNKQNPRVYGAFNFYDTNASFNDIHNMNITNGAGKLSFDNVNTHFVTSSAKLNNSPISIDGTCTLYGVLNFIVKAPNQDLGNLLSIIKNSPMLKDMQYIGDKFTTASGETDFNLNLTGTVKNLDDIIFGKNIFANGSIILKNAAVKFEGCPALFNSTYGKINFKNLNIDLDLTSNLAMSPLRIKGELTDSLGKFNLTSSSFKLKDIIELIPISKRPKNNAISLANSATLKLNANFTGDINKISLKDIDLKAFLIASSKKDPLFLSSGQIEFTNNKLRFFNVKGSYKASTFDFSTAIDNLAQKNQNINGDLDFKNFDASIFNEIKVLFAPQYHKYLSQFKNFKGKAELKGHIRNNHTNGFLKFNDVTFEITQNAVPVRIIGGNIHIQNKNIFINQINAIADSTPIFTDGKITLGANPTINLTINSKPNQQIIDRYFNRKSIYPIKLRGNIQSTSKISGHFNDFNVKTDLKLDSGAQISYMGAIFGDFDNPIKLYLDSDFSKNKLFVKSFNYDKVLTSQNHRQYNSRQLNASGLIIQNDKTLAFNDFKIKTTHPTDARIFNILFKKPIIKQGLFTSDMKIDGSIKNPSLKGYFNISKIDIPFMDTKIHDISLNFKNKQTILIAKGNVIGNSIALAANIQNKFSAPFLINNLDLHVEDLNINKITNSINRIELETSKHKNSTIKQAFDISSIVIRKGKVYADKITVKNLRAEDFSADISLNDKMLFSIDKFKFTIAQGHATGFFRYNLLNNRAIIDLRVNNANADEFSYALFDLENQIDGNLTGEINLRCNGKTHKDCMRTLAGHGGFEVRNGRMPKLGSLEYLLKAGNLVKSGVTGFSINSLMDLVTPLKTGEFETIKGSFYVNDGTTDTIQIFTKGKNLSLFITGKYNFSTFVAQMNVFGRLSKKVSNILGPVGNASLNTLFNIIPGVHLDENNKSELVNDINKIPAIELDTRAFRIFTAEILGDITGDDYVKSFKWIE